MIQFPYALSGQDDKMQLSKYMLILAVVALSARQLPLNQTIKYSLVWLTVILGLIFAYSFKDEFLKSRIVAELLPNRAIVMQNGSMSLRASNDGHFYVEAKVNGVPVNFMIDTGASDVVLSRQDAQRIGINIKNLSYTRAYQTANGITGGAPVKLNRLQIADFTLDDFPASVNQGNINGSVLGMTALRSLGGFSIDGDKMVIGREKQ